MERAWRHVKKPLLSIGAKGATQTHGNSLRQLLDAHTAVKVKVNTRKYNNSLIEAFDSIRNLAVDAGASPHIELLQARDGDHTILFGLPGTREKIRNGEFPPKLDVVAVDKDGEMEAK
jgi:RNA-binding protein YhbY